MKFVLKQITIVILFSTVISCNGQVKEDKHSLQVEKVSEINKIPVPKNGFSMNNLIAAFEFLLTIPDG